MIDSGKSTVEKLENPNKVHKLSSVDTRDAKEYELKEAVIRICPSCGVANPAGPSGGCPHLQLVRFNGVSESLEKMLGDVAVARREYASQVAKLKKEVMTQVRDGVASVETPHDIKASEVDGLYATAGKAGIFNLTHPEIKKSKQKRSTPPKKKKEVGIPAMDSRQLDLLAQSVPKGEA